MSTIATSDHGSEILVRTIKPAEGGMSAEAAREILHFKLSNDDRDRVNQLAAKAREGTLKPDERSELDDYERVTALLELMQSKARVSLKQAGLSP
jgi:hypothetical protein